MMDQANEVAALAKHLYFALNQQHHSLPILRMQLPQASYLLLPSARKIRATLN